MEGGTVLMEWLLEYLNPSNNCTSFCCSEVQNISGRWKLHGAAEELWAWALACVMVPCLRHYIIFIISLLLCVVLASGTVRLRLSFTNPSATSNRSVECSRLYNLTLLITSTVAFSWLLVCVSRYWIGFRSSWSLVPFHECVFAMAEALTFLTFSSKLWLDYKQQADLNFRPPQRHEACCWLTNFIIFSAFEGYPIIAELCISQASAQHPGELSTIYLTFPPLLASLFLAVLALFGKTSSWLLLSVAAAEDSSLTEPLSSMRISTTHAKLMEINGVKDEAEESVTRFWKASLQSKATFVWLNPLLATGNRRALMFEDVPSLSPEDSAQVVYHRLHCNWEVEQHHQEAGGLKSLTWGLIKTFWPRFAFNAFLASVKLSVMYIGPLLIQQFIDFSADPDRDASHGVKLVFVLLLAKCMELLVDHQYGFLSQRLGLSVQGALVASVYQKVLRLSSSARQTHSVGNIVNYMSTDVEEFCQAFIQIQDLWALPLQIVLALVILYSIIGVATLTSFLTMLGVMLTCLYIAKEQKGIMVKIMACKDNRIKRTNEAVSSMRILKLQAWQYWFLQQVQALEKCQLAAAVRQKEEKLDAPVAENGDNLSMGQRQLFCLGHVLLKRSHILVLDEATASIDTQTDVILQKTIKMEFKDCTIIIVAHRIPSVMDSDKVLVLEAGMMKEFGTPSSLLENPSSLFSLLVQEYWSRSKNTGY